MSDVAFRVQLPDSVVVTASRVASAAQKTGRRVTIYTQNDIQKLPVNSLDQLHDVVGGLDVQSRGGFGVQSDLLMQGSESVWWIDVQPIRAKRGPKVMPLRC